jgi:hypothetical protein
LTDEEHAKIKAVLDAFPGSKILRVGKKMRWNLEQIKAITKAGEAAGGYLETLDKTDLAKLTPIEWRVLLETIIDTYNGELIPF